MSFCATGKECPMLTEKKIILELPDYYVTISFRPKNSPKPDNDNAVYDFRGEELAELLDKYDK
jgi:hypothetical protein